MRVHTTNRCECLPLVRISDPNWRISPRISKRLESKNNQKQVRDPEKEQETFLDTESNSPPKRKYSPEHEELDLPDLDEEKQIEGAQLDPLQSGNRDN